MTNYDRRQLKYFVAVAEELHFGRAAQRLHMSQPPLSQQIAALEMDLGVQLLIRTKRKVEITPAGQQFLQDARTLLLDMEKAGVRARAVAEGQTGTLRIGLNYSAPIHPILSKIFRRFKKLYPHVALEMHENTSAKQLAGLYHRTLDLCFIWSTRDDASSDIAINPITKDELKIVMSCEHPLARKRILTPLDLKDQTIYLTLRQTRMPFFDVLTSACRKHGFTPTIRTDVIQVPFIMNIVAASEAIAFIPEFFQRIQPEGVLFHKCGFIPEANRQMPLSLAYRSHETSPLVMNFANTIKAFIT